MRGSRFSLNDRFGGKPTFFSPLLEDRLAPIAVIPVPEIQVRHDR